MLHDTFCTPSTYDMNNNTNNKNNNNTNDNNGGHDHVNPNTNFATPLKFDTLDSPISPQPRSSNSSLTTSSASSYDESRNLNDQKLVLWIQRQLEFYTTLTIIPRFSCIDDIGHGKLLLCLIHRFSPRSLPCLVTTLDQKTSIECLLMADDLAQQLWDTTVDSLPIYLYHHYHQQQQQQQQQQRHQQYQYQQDTIGDFVDQLIVPSAFTTTTPTRHHDSISDNIGEENHAQLPAAASLPFWKPLANDVDLKTMTSSITRKWIETTHYSIRDHLQHSRTKRLHSRLTLLEQLQQIYVNFTRLSTSASSHDINDDFIQPTQQLDNRLDRIKDALHRMTATDDDDGGGGGNYDDDDDDTYLVDVLVQRHMSLQSWVRSALCLYQQSSKVQTWVHEQKEWMMKHGVDADWLDVVLQYQQENMDVKALMDFCRNTSSNSNETNKKVTHVTIGTVIMTLDDLDSLISNAKQISQHDHAWQNGLTQWQAVYTRSLAELGTLDDSVLALAHQSKWNPDEQQQSTSFLQQWKILSRRVAHLGNTTDGEYGYATVASLYQKLDSIAAGFASSTTPTTRMEAVDRDYGVFIQKWKKLELDLHMSRQIITHRQRIQDFLHQCHMIQIRAAQLEGQLDGCVNLYQKPWLKGQVDELDDDISRALVLANGLVTAIGDDDIAKLTQYWKQALDQCKSGYRQAWLCYQSKCAGLERHQELEKIKQVMMTQLDTLASAMFDPWTCALDEFDGLKQAYGARKRQFIQIFVSRFDQWVKDQVDEDDSDLVMMIAQDIRVGIEKGQKLLMDYECRLNILEKRLAWEQQLDVSTAWIKQTENSIHVLVDSRSSNSNGSSSSSILDAIQKQILGYKHNIDLVQQTLDTLLAMDDNTTRSTTVIARMQQRQQLLEDQVNNLDELLKSANAVVGQTVMVGTYMSTVQEMDHASKSLGDRLDSGLMSTGAITDQVEMDQELQALESSAVQLWQHSGSQIPYPLSFLVVDDLVRWKVLAAYDDVLAALFHLVHDLDSWNKRATWENQWQLDMNALKQNQQHLSMYLQQLDNNNNSNNDSSSNNTIMDDEINDTITTVYKYIEYPLQQLEQLFLNTQLSYPVNIKMPLALEEQQQHLSVGVCDHVKSLCGLVKYLQTAKQLEDKCDDMNATLDQNGVDASEELVQQWLDDINVSVEQELFTSLCDQQVQLRNGVDVFGKENVWLVRDKASTMLGDLKNRLATALKTSQHTRLVQAYGQSADAFELSLHQLQDDLASSANEYGKMVPGDGGDVYEEREESLHTKWKEAKLAMETTHTGSYNDVRCLCQVIQLQQEELDVATRQSHLDDLWQVVLKELNGVEHLVSALAQWRDLSSSLGKVEKMLVPAYDSMDMTSLTITSDLASVVKTLPMIYQDAHTTLAAIGGMVPSAESCVVLYDDHNRGVFFDRFNHLSSMVDGLLTALLHCTEQESSHQRDLILKRLASLTQMPLFDLVCDGGGMSLVKQWDDLTLNMEQGALKYDFVNKTMDSLVALCDDTGSSSYTMCKDSVDDLGKAATLEKLCCDTILTKAVEFGHLASKLLLCMNDLGKELTDFDPSSHQDMDLRLLEYRVTNFGKNDMQEFISKSQEWTPSVDSSADMADDVVNELGQHVQQDIRGLVHQVEMQWDRIKAQLKEATQAQQKHLAEQQWQGLLTLVDTACDRASELLTGLDHIGSKNGSVVSTGSSLSGDDDDEEDESMVHMMGQEQDLVAAEQAMTILDYEMRPLLKSKAVEMKSILDTLLEPWISHVDVDNALDKWEQMLQKHKQRLQHGMTMCQYWAAAAEVHGYLFAMEQVIDKNNPEVMVPSPGFMMVDGHAIAVELETKHKVYSDALTLSLEKARQVATMVDLGQTDYPYLVTRRNKLEQRYNDRMKEWIQWIGSTNGNNNNSSSSNSSSNSSGSNGSTNSSRLSGLRSRKISLPSKMPSPPPPHVSATVSTRRRVASSTSSSSSPLLQAQRKIMGRKPSFTNANSTLRPPPPVTTPAPAPNSYVADPKNDLDMEIGRIVNKAPYKVELQMVPGSAGRYRFGDKVVYCRILKSHMVMVRVGGGWTELSQFLRDHALVGHGSGFMMQKSSMENCQEAFLETKRATSPTTGRPLPRMSQSTSTSSSISGNAGYKDGDRYIAVDIQGQQHEMKMTPHDSTSSRRR